MIKNFILNMIMPDPKFKSTDLIHNGRNGFVFEVQKVLYDRNLNPVILATVVDNGDMVVTLSGVDLEEYKHYNGTLNGAITTI